MGGMRTLLSIILLVVSTNANAKTKKPTCKVPELKRIETSLVVDADSGKILHNVNGSQKIYPASLTKLMTLYMAFDALKSSRLYLDRELKISINAEKMKPCKLGLKAGETITAKDAILGLIVKSANDAAVVIAEALAKDEDSFAKAMTQMAHKLGMQNSHFYNASGWHHPEQKTTASDLARLTLAIKRDFPEYYSWFSKDQFKYNGRIIVGHNKVAKNYPGAEGMKTGYTYPAGFNLITTAKRDGKRLIGIVTGSPAAGVRDAKMVKLLDKHFASLGATNDSVFNVKSRGVNSLSGNPKKYKAGYSVKTKNLAVKNTKLSTKKFNKRKKSNKTAKTLSV